MENEHLKKGALVFQGFLSLFPAYAGVIPGTGHDHGNGCPFPRIRGGDPLRQRSGFIEFYLFPAYAGVIPGMGPGWCIKTAFPRIRGGDPWAV